MVYKTIMDSIDQSLNCMRTDYLDLIQLHSCSLDILEAAEQLKPFSKQNGRGKPVLSDIAEIMKKLTRQLE